MVLNRYHTKREVAFLMSFQAVWQSSPRCYFWTFTPKGVMSDAQFAAAWQRFQVRWFRWWQDDAFRGVRVFEPFKSGFMHCHAVVNTRFPVDAMRRIADGTGIGRIHVRRARPHDAEYLAKYMFKLSGKLPDNRRAWAAIGGWQHTAIRNVEIKSTGSEIFRYAFHCVYARETRHTVRFMEARRWAQNMYAQVMANESYADVTASPSIGPDESYAGVTRPTNSATTGKNAPAPSRPEVQGILL